MEQINEVHNFTMVDSKPIIEQINEEQIEIMDGEKASFEEFIVSDISLISLKNSHLHVRIRKGLCNVGEGIWGITGQV